MHSHTIHRGILFALMLSLGALTLLSLPHVSEANDGSMQSIIQEARLQARKNASSTVSVNTTCMASAVETRETALASAWSELNTSLTSALSDRKTALIAAWNLSSATERSSALKAAWKEWKADKKSAHTEFRKDRKAAWDAFKKTAKDSCKVTVPKDEALEKTEKDTVAL